MMLYSCFAFHRKIYLGLTSVHNNKLHLIKISNDYVPELFLVLNYFPHCMSCKMSGKRDVESLKAFALEEAEKAAEKAQLDTDKEL